MTTWRGLASVAVLIVAIGLALDLLFSHLEERVTPRRHVVLALFLVALVTGRIVQRLQEGSL